MNMLDNINMLEKRIIESKTYEDILLSMNEFDMEWGMVLSPSFIEMPLRDQKVSVLRVLDFSKKL